MQTIGQLALPLKQSQIDAASKFWSEGNWQSAEFEQLKQAFPDPADAVRIKAIVVNVLYGTNIFAIQKAADCIENVLKREHAKGPDLVEELVTEIHSVTNRNHYSFASKFAHFFVDSSLPILDSYAEWMLEQHLGVLRSASPKRYERFTINIETLIRVAGLNCTCEELDAYLWIAGEYYAWEQSPQAKITKDLVRVFESLSHNVADQSVLAIVLGLSTPTTVAP